MKMRSKAMIVVGSLLLLIIVTFVSMDYLSIWQDASYQHPLTSYQNNSPCPLRL